MTREPQNDSWPRSRGGRLTGMRVALSGDGGIDRVADVLEREGALCLRCPAMAAVEGGDRAGVQRWLETLVTSPPDDVVFLSAEGVQQLLATADRLGLSAAVHHNLARCRRIARGTRTACMLQALSLGPQIFSVAPTSRGLIECLRSEDLVGRAVGVQLAGRDPAHELRSFLVGRNASVWPVAPHGCAPAVQDQEVLDFVADVVGGNVDAFLFTSALEVALVCGLTDQRDPAGALRAALNTIPVAGVGAGTVAELRRLGVRFPLALDRRFFLRRLVAVLGETRGRGRELTRQVVAATLRLAPEGVASRRSWHSAPPH